MSTPSTINVGIRSWCWTTLINTPRFKEHPGSSSDTAVPSPTFHHVNIQSLVIAK